MCECEASREPGTGPFATGRALVEFVLKAHGGAVAQTALPNGGLASSCQGCGAPFVLKTFVQSCSVCGGVHAVAPPRANDPDAIQFAGNGFVFPGC